jgi:hypothetical protein
MTKSTYKDAKNKKAVREFIFSHYVYNKIVGLAGPDINDYITWCKSKGYSDIEIWEQDPVVMMKQLSEVKTGVSFKYGNILNASVSSRGVVYDLDYCATIKYMGEHLKKFKETKFVMTFALRYSEKETIKKFFRDRGEAIVCSEQVTSPLLHTRYVTNNGTYLYAKYRDTTPMCVFSKIK